MSRERREKHKVQSTNSEELRAESLALGTQCSSQSTKYKEPNIISYPNDKWPSTRLRYWHILANSRLRLGGTSAGKLMTSILEVIIMKAILISITIGVFIAVLFTGCKEESNRITNIDQTPDFKGQLTTHSDCKRFQIAGLSSDSSDSSSCIEYSFDAGSHKLTLKQINAGFNCCPESLYSLISLLNDTIIIEEYEKIAGCHCDCLFDLDMEIHGVEAKKYHIKMIEPYCGDQEKLFFDVDLATMQQGSYCVKRTGYPWGGA